MSEETGRVLGSDSTGIFRYNDDETATVVARWGENEETVLPVGFVIPLDRRRDDAARPCRSASPL
ncbi:MAG: hypothetical protein M3540_02755 [Actinomycetota bacterium]|nr:hypothetical protein [Actinomycetota bacterium]